MTTLTNKRMIYVAHCIAGDVDNNLVDLARILKLLNTNESLRSSYFCAPYYADAVALDDNDPIQLKIAIENNTALIMTEVFDEIWLTGPKISLGMQEEIKLFRLLGKLIVDMTNKL